MRGFSLCLLIVTKRNEDVNASIRVLSVCGGSVCGIITADCGWGRLGLKTLSESVMNRQDACSTTEEFSFCTSVMNRQDACSTTEEFCFCTSVMNRQDACSTTEEFCFLWGGHASPPLKALLRMVQPMSFKQL